MLINVYTMVSVTDQLFTVLMTTKTVLYHKKKLLIVMCNYIDINITDINGRFSFALILQLVILIISCTIEFSFI